ncbi:MAG: GDP-mannose 4,6-dehydratase [Fibrobacterota bacterium]
MILITGVAGFIGHALAKSLLEDGCDVLGVDSLNDYYDTSLKTDRNHQLQQYDTYTFIHGSTADRPVMEKIFREYVIEKVCHLAAQAGVRYSIENPHAYGEANLTGFLTILEGCRSAKIPRLVYASSSSVYGGNKKVPFTETDPVDAPVSLYAATKKANELMAHSYTHLYGMETVGLRFFTVYGPMGRPDMAYFKFADRIFRGAPIDIYNNGDMRRDFTYIDDIVGGIRGALFNEMPSPCEIFNLGNNQAIPLMDFISVIEKAAGKSANKRFLPMQPGDVYETYADISKAQNILDYTPRTTIDTGIPAFISWYKNYYGVTS